MILVTGATGSVGGNVCRLAAARGIDVRALVRPGSAVDTLVALGVEPVVGDVTDRASLDVASRGVDGVVHCAAQIGGTWSTAEPKDFEAVNQRGTINVLDAAQAAGAARTVVLLSAVVNDRRVTATETSPIAPLETSNSPYLRTKLAAYYEGMARAARGVDVNFVVPGGVYGPTPLVERALVPTIFTGTLLMAARGELRRYLPMPIPWVLAEDVADIALRRSNGVVPGTATWRWDDRVTRARSPSSVTPSSNWPGSTTGSRSSTPPVQERTTTRSSDRW